MSPENKDLRDACERGAMDRRDFLARLAAITGGAAAAAVIVPALEGEAGAGQLVPPDDPRLETGYVKYPIEGGEMRAYSAKPKGAGKLAGMPSSSLRRATSSSSSALASSTKYQCSAVSEWLIWVCRRDRREAEKAAAPRSLRMFDMAKGKG